MDEQDAHGEDELGLDLDTTTAEALDTSATDTDDQETESDDEQEQDTLDLEDSSVTTQEKGKAELAKEKLVNDWTRKVEGKLKSLDDIPKDQAWLIPLVEAKLGKTKPVNDDAIDRKLDERENARKLDSLKGELKSMDLSSEQKSKLEGKYKTLKIKGLAPLDALLEAMEFAGVNPEEMALDARRYAARLRTPGNYVKGKADPAALESAEGFGAVAKKVDQDKAWEYLKKQL